MLEILIFIHGNRFLMNEIKLSFIKNPVLMEEIQIFTITNYVSFSIVRYRVSQYIIIIIIMSYHQHGYP